MTQARRRLAVPADPSEDELARHWSLTPADLAVIAECRGADHRRRFALQLCMLRAHGRFLDDYRHAPIKIVNHLSRQLGLAPVLFLDRPGRAQTEREQSLRIRRYLGIRGFDRQAAADLRDWLRQGAIEGRTAAELMARAEDRAARLAGHAAGPSTLERLVVAEVTHATTDLYDKVTSRLPPTLRAAIDLLVEVPEGDARSSLFRLKDYPKSANAAVIKGDIVRLHLIEELLGAGAGLDDLDPRIVRQLGQLGPPLRCRRSPPLRQAQARRARRLLSGRGPQDAARPDRRDERPVPDRHEPPLAQRRREAPQEPAPPRPRWAAPRARRGRCAGDGGRRANRQRLARGAGRAGADRGGHRLPGLRAAGGTRSSRRHARALRHAPPIPAGVPRPAVPGCSRTARPCSRRSRSCARSMPARAAR